jgi:hypothetical protein
MNLVQKAYMAPWLFQPCDDDDNTVVTLAENTVSTVQYTTPPIFERSDPKDGTRPRLAAGCWLGEAVACLCSEVED